MTRSEAERIIEDMTKPVFAFALKRCRTVEDAEDLSQEILMRAYRALTVRNDVFDPEKYVWTVAHNSLANYYRECRGVFAGIVIEDIADKLGVCDEYFKDEDAPPLERMRTQIAYLSKIQRRIVIAYYYENKKQSEIAKELNIPVGTVKWHLFEAKRELKKGMEQMIDINELKFNPVKFSHTGFSGSVGKEGAPHKQLGSVLAQNIVYAASRKAMTVNEIAKAVGVSPVYVESEAEYLEKYGHLIKKGDRYLGNVLINEPTAETVKTIDEVYEEASSLVAGELFDAIASSGITDGELIEGGVKDPETNERFDKNYFMWSLILHAADRQFCQDEMPIRFEDAATIRPDGGVSICQADVLTPGTPLLKWNDSIGKWFGPCWHRLDDGILLWTVDSEWTGFRLTHDSVERSEYNASLLSKYLKRGDFSKEELAYLAERGFIGISPSGKHALRCLCIDKEAKEKLDTIAGEINKKYSNRLSSLRKLLLDKFLETTPEHMKLAERCICQYIFTSDGIFMLYCAKRLVADGKLLPLREDEKNSAVMMIITE